MRSLRQLLEAPRDPTSVVARRWNPASRADRFVDWRELRHDVDALGRRFAVEPEGPWVLLSQDAYAFAVGLLALWHSGRHALSPPNHQQGSLRVLQTRAAGVLSDRPDWFPEGSSIHPLEPDAPDGDFSLTALDRDALAMELYTSGTTGAEKPVTKRLRHLEDEVAALGATWDTALRDGTVFSTASHQHLYGLLFGVLWPLCSGRAFHAEHFLHMGELVPRMRGAGPCVLVSVPTHLKRFARHGDAASLRDPCRIVFSSGGPLPAETAHAVADVLGQAPVEVLGSTETGGIGWRTQEPAREVSPWTPFAGVRVTRDGDSGVARVSSPFVSADESGAGFTTGDRITLHPDGSFQLEGRSDRVVKVGEKRLDLAQMESQLRGHPWVANVALTTLDRDDELRVAAAVVPTGKGWRVLRGKGRRSFVRALAATLGEDWDPVLHPRHWRTVEELPEDAQGKVTADALRRLFLDPHIQGEELELSAADRPEVFEEIRGDDFIEWSCAVPPDLSCFPGHFPDLAVVPGVLQLDWAMDLAGRLLGRTPRVAEVESLKLRAALWPGSRFAIRVRASSDTRIDFEIRGGDAVHATGRVRLESDVEPAE